MNAKVQMWGNSLGLRIPSFFARQLGIDEGRIVSLSVEKSALVVTPIDHKPKYRLEDLVAGITDENRHDEVATGASVGAEFG